MSVVSNIILTFSGTELKAPGAANAADYDARPFLVVEAINGWLTEHCGGQTLGPSIRHLRGAVGGGKVLETEMLVAAVNYLDFAIIAFCRSLEWRYRERAQLLILHDDEESWWVFEMDERRQALRELMPNGPNAGRGM